MTIDELIKKYNNRAYKSHLKRSHERKEKHENLRLGNLEEATECELDQVFYETEMNLCRAIVNDLRKLEHCRIGKEVTNAD